MPDLPNLTAADVAATVPGASDIRHVEDGGQKVVFRATIGGETYAVKFALVREPLGADEESSEDVASTRARREVETMRDCTSPHMVKLGPVGLTFGEIAGQKVLYFTEEFIPGSSLREILQKRETFSPDEIVRLGLHITDAIRAVWDLGKVHRDIKPGNIIRRDNQGYVLLDAGLVFDIAGPSLSAGYLVGTPRYFSPEQLDYSSRRSGLDFRSDMFSLGVTMYEMATGQHPFASAGLGMDTTFARILNDDPVPPRDIIGDAFPERLQDIILRMLEKSKHLRFRTCDRLLNALGEVR